MTHPFKIGSKVRVAGHSKVHTVTHVNTNLSVHFVRVNDGPMWVRAGVFEPAEEDPAGLDDPFRGSLTDDCQPGVPLKFRE